MKFLSILFYIIAGVSLANFVKVSNQASAAGESTAYFVGLFLPVVICVGLGLLFGKLQKRDGLKKE